MHIRACHYFELNQVPGAQRDIHKHINTYYVQYICTYMDARNVHKEQN